MSRTGTGRTIAYVRREDAPLLPPPTRAAGPLAWLRQNLFSSVGSTLVTLVLAFLLGTVAWTILDWAVVRAVWTGLDREACAVAEAGACWPFVWAKFPQWLFGFYTIGERWRPAIVFLIGAAALVPMLVPSAPYKFANALFLIVVFPVIALVLLTGGNFTVDPMVYGVILLPGLIGLALSAVSGSPLSVTSWLLVLLLAFALLGLLDVDLGLLPVETSNWGGLLVTLVVSVTGIAASLPLGILLALGRRSKMPAVRLVCVVFIEVWRGVPLITVLFMASVLLPLFLPGGITVDKLLRALIGISLFAAAYMAEVVRGGLQGIGRGQYEGAMALGLSYWPMMWNIVLPQALRISIPNIVGTFIGLFKDTTLVLIVGIYDFLGIITAGTQDSKWAAPETSNTGYFVAAIVYWAFCFGMSRYAIFTEKRLAAGARR